MKYCFLRVCELTIFSVLLCVPSCFPQGRRYDIEEESLKLYHQDLKSVVQKFRRSPEYLRILKEQVTEMFRELEMLETFLFLYQKEEVERRAKEIIHRNETEPPCVNSSVAEATTPVTAAGGRRKDEYTTKNHRVSMLDSYPAFRDRLQVADRNTLRDIGFEEAGNLIHKIIQAFEESYLATTPSNQSLSDQTSTAAGKDSVSVAADTNLLMTQITSSVTGSGSGTTHVARHVVTKPTTTQGTLFPTEATLSPAGARLRVPQNNKTKNGKTKTASTKKSTVKTKSTKPTKTTKGKTTKPTKTTQQSKTTKTTTTKPPKTTKVKTTFSPKTKKQTTTTKKSKTTLKKSILKSNNKTLRLHKKPVMSSFERFLDMAGLE